MIDSNKREYLNRGTVLFPMQHYKCDTSQVLYDLPLHWHTDFEIVHIIEGEYNMFIGGGERVLHTGDVAFISSGVMHGDGAVISPCKFESVVFDPEMLRHRQYEADSFLSRLIDDVHIQKGTWAVIDTVFRCTEPDAEDAIQTALKLFSVMEARPRGVALMATGLTLQLLGIIESYHLYLESSNLDKSQEERIKRLKGALDYMRENYASQLTLDALSGSVCLSTRHFCKVFRKMTKCSPIDYLNKYRIHRASDLLRRSNKSVAEISTECGFSDTSYFIRLFRRYKGMTPLKYKKAVIAAIKRATQYAGGASKGARGNAGMGEVASRAHFVCYGNEATFCPVL